MLTANYLHFSDNQWHELNERIDPIERLINGIIRLINGINRVTNGIIRRSNGWGALAGAPGPPSPSHPPLGWGPRAAALPLHPHPPPSNTLN